jgi:hypothetical protein
MDFYGKAYTEPEAAVHLSTQIVFKSKVATYNRRSRLTNVSQLFE